MSPNRSDMRLTGADVLCDGEMQRRPLAIRDGVIAKGNLPEVDLTGYLVLPGIVDMHGDAFERHIAPRPNASFPLKSALAATDRDAAANGVTTAWLAQSWSWEGGRRSPDFAENLLEAVAACRPALQTDMRVQLRCETHTVDTAQRLLGTIEHHGVDYVVFNNHLEDALHMAANRPEELAFWAKGAGRTVEGYMEIVQEARKLSKSVPRFLCRLAESFDRLGVLYGSHDDPDAETRETFSMIGAKICEFPLTRAAAKLARAVNDPVIMGAPNVVRGGSQSGNAAAEDLIEAGYCDVLVSDYHYPSLVLAVFHLLDQGVRSLPGAWKLVSENPAGIMRLPDRGVIEQGRRADLVVVNETTRAVEATLVAGRISFMTAGAAERFLRARPGMAMAAE